MLFDDQLYGASADELLHRLRDVPETLSSVLRSLLSCFRLQGSSCSERGGARTPGVAEYTTLLEGEDVPVMGGMAPAPRGSGVVRAVSKAFGREVARAPLVAAFVTERARSRGRQ